MSARSCTSARRSTSLIAIVLAVMCAAPTVGDIGSCNEPATPLDATQFFTLRDQDECARCAACGLSTARCTDACNPPKNSAFPAGCAPVVHDGEVCLRALEALSCGDFASVVGDPPIVPTECDFCPAALAVEDAGAEGAP